MKTYRASPIVLVLIAVLAGGCGGGQSEPAPDVAGSPVTPTEPASVTGGPTEPPPSVPGVSSAPPPAWVETNSGKRWLAFFSYCWTNTCVDSRPVSQRSDIPEIRVETKEAVLFHLAFVPTELVLHFGGRSLSLATAEVAEWRAPSRLERGIVRIVAHNDGLRAEYVARLVVA